MVGLSYIDATYMEIAEASGSFECKKFSAPFYVQSKFPDRVVLRGMADGTLWQTGQYDAAVDKGSIYERTVPLEIFLARFETVVIDGHSSDKICCLKHSNLLAVQMRCDFGVITLDEDSVDFEQIFGKPGDYLVDTSLGLKAVVKQEDFKRMYQTEFLEKNICPATNLKLALRKMVTAKSDHDFALM